MVGGNEVLNNSAVPSTSSSFTDDTDVDHLSRDGAKRHDVAEGDDHGLRGSAATNIAEERLGEHSGVPSTNEAAQPVLSTVILPTSDSATDAASWVFAATIVRSHGQGGGGARSSDVDFSHLGPQQSMEDSHRDPSRWPHQGFAGENSQHLGVLSGAVSAADGENDVMDNDATVYHAMTNDETPEMTNADEGPNDDLEETEVVAGLLPHHDYASHDNYNDDSDDNDDDYGGHYHYLHNGNLIELSDLFGFAHDRLPPTLPGNAGSDDDDFSGIINNTEKFYVSDDDEFSIGDAIDAEDIMDTDTAYEGRYVGSVHSDNDATASGPPLPDGLREYLPSTHDEDGHFEEEAEVDGVDDDVHDDPGGPAISSDSTDTHFLKYTQFCSTPRISTLPHDMQLVLERRGNTRNHQNGPMDTPELAARFLQSFSPGLVQPRVQNILGDFSLSKFSFADAAAHHGILIQKPEDSSVADPRSMCCSSDMDDCNSVTITFSHRMLLFDLRSSSPVTTVGRTSGRTAYLSEQQGASIVAGRSTSAAERNNPSATPPLRPLLSEMQYEDIHRPSEHSLYFVEPALILKAFDAPIASSLLATPLAPSEDEMYSEANGVVFPALERNLTFSQFVRQWFLRSRIPHALLGTGVPFVPVAAEAAHVVDWYRPPKISRPENKHATNFDIQGIPWHQKLKVSRADARILRDRLYTSYHNLKYRPHGYASTLPHREGYFQPKTMYTKYKATMEHFQLRNLMSVTASNTLQYACRSKIYSVTPFYDERNCLMDFSNPSPSSRFLNPVRITAMKAKHGVTVAGGFAGEYAFKGEISDHSAVEGFVTRELDGITTHIDIVKHRTSDSPQVVISSNDAGIRTLDCETNTFVHDHKFAQPINCTDTSPDGRLRVIVGDAPDAWVVDAQTGKPLQSLGGHRDFGFACAWSPDMLHIATSNQDKTVNIWDARMWRPLQTINSDVACYRSLHFSPVGGGPRTLLMCEPADRISIVNAQTYQTRQVHDFFGEIGGAGFSPDGGRIWVANMDPEFGGFMEFDRRQWGQEFGIGHTRRRHIECRGDMYYPDLPNEWLREEELDNDERCVLGPGERRLRFQRTLDDDHQAIHPSLG